MIVVGVVLIIGFLFTAYLCARKLDQQSPLARRSGQNGSPSDESQQEQQQSGISPAKLQKMLLSLLVNRMVFKPAVEEVELASVEHKSDSSYEPDELEIGQREKPELPMKAIDNMSTEEPDEFDCSICLESVRLKVSSKDLICSEDPERCRLKTRKLLQTRCCRQFLHKDCVMDWLESRLAQPATDKVELTPCPYCREPLFNPQELIKTEPVEVPPWSFPLRLIFFFSVEQFYCRNQVSVTLVEHFALLNCSRFLFIA